MRDEALTVLTNLVRRYGPQHWFDDGQLVRNMVIMILIQQATAGNVEKAMSALSPHLTIAGLNALTDAELEALVRPAGFFKQKTRAIRAILAWFAQYDNDATRLAAVPTPELRKQLLAVRGVGQETADVMMLYLFGRRVFIGDQYALRLFNRLGLGPFKDYQVLRAALQPLAESQPYETVREWHAVIDEHGKQFRRDSTMDEGWLLAPVDPMDEVVADSASPTVAKSVTTLAEVAENGIELPEVAENATTLAPESAGESKGTVK